MNTTTESDSTLDPDMTLEEAKELLRDKFEEGASCPCCGQNVKLYKRKLNSAMAYTLILLHRYFRDARAEKWLHVPSYLNSISLPPRVSASIRGDWAKLRFWGFIQDMPGERADKSKRAGYWRITDVGRQFAKGEVLVPSHVYIYNQKPFENRQRRHKKQISIYEALGERFSYEELMRGGGYGQ
jgi:hypothetical protein